MPLPKLWGMEPSRCPKEWMCESLANEGFDMSRFEKILGRSPDAICEAARIPLHRLNVNPLPNEAELRGLLDLPPLPQCAPVFHLRDSAQR